MNRKTGLICLLLVFLIVAISGCSDKKASTNGQANGQNLGGQTIQSSGSGVQNTESMSGNSHGSTTGSDKASLNYGETVKGASGSGNEGTEGSGGKVYIAYDNDFKGTGMITSMYPNYCYVPVMGGDTVEVWANSDRPARFLSGGQGLLNHYIIYNGVSGMSSVDNYYSDIIESESTNGGTEYHKVIDIKDYTRMMFVFAVQDENGGNDVTGHMKIKITSTQSKDQHNQAFSAGLDAGKAEAERQLQKAGDIGKY